MWALKFEYFPSCIFFLMRSIQSKNGMTIQPSTQVQYCAPLFVHNKYTVFVWMDSSSMLNKQFAVAIAILIG